MRRLLWSGRLLPNNCCCGRKSQIFLSKLNITMAIPSTPDLKNVVTCVRSKGTWTFPKFSDCVVDLLAADQKFIEVMCCLRNNLLMIAPANESKSFSDLSDSYPAQCQPFGPVSLEHSIVCPILEVMKGKTSDIEIKFPENKQHVVVAVAVLLESSDSYVLLTKRASTMRSYPGVWVPPGGHLDKGETLLECGLRELEEETGLKVCQSNIKASYICLWEAVAPPMLFLGSPRSHSTVVYIHIQVPFTRKEMQPKIIVNQDEVQAWCWFTRHTIQHLQRQGETTVLVYKPGEVPGKWEEEEVNPATMFRRPYLWAQDMFYSGTHQALVLWSRNSSKL